MIWCLINFGLQTGMQYYHYCEFFLSIYTKSIPLLVALDAANSKALLLFHHVPLMCVNNNLLGGNGQYEIRNFQIIFLFF